MDEYKRRVRDLEKLVQQHDEWVIRTECRIDLLTDTIILLANALNKPQGWFESSTNIEYRKK